MTELTEGKCSSAASKCHPKTMGSRETEEYKKKDGEALHRKNLFTLENLKNTTTKNKKHKVCMHVSEHFYRAF